MFTSRRALRVTLIRDAVGEMWSASSAKYERYHVRSLEQHDPSHRRRRSNFHCLLLFHWTKSSSMILKLKLWTQTEPCQWTFRNCKFYQLATLFPSLLLPAPVVARAFAQHFIIEQITEETNKFYAINDGAGSALNCKDRGKRSFHFTFQFFSYPAQAGALKRTTKITKITLFVFHPPLLLLLFHFILLSHGMCISWAYVYLCPSRLPSQLSFSGLLLLPSSLQ